MLLRRRLLFLLALPLTLAFTRKRIDSERKDIDRFANAIVNRAERLSGVTRKRGRIHTTGSCKSNVTGI